MTHGDLSVQGLRTFLDMAGGAKESLVALVEERASLKAERELLGSTICGLREALRREREEKEEVKAANVRQGWEIDSLRTTVDVEKDEALQLRRALKVKEEEAEAKGEEVNQLAQQLRAKEEEAKAKGGEVVQLEEQLRVKEEDLRGKGEEVVWLGEEMVRLGDRLKVKEGEAEAKGEEVVQLKDRLKVKEEEAAAKDKEMGKVQQHLLDKETAFNQIREKHQTVKKCWTSSKNALKKHMRARLKSEAYNEFYYLFILEQEKRLATAKSGQLALFQAMKYHEAVGGAVDGLTQAGERAFGANNAAISAHFTNYLQKLDGLKTNDVENFSQLQFKFPKEILQGLDEKVDGMEKLVPLCKKAAESVQAFGGREVKKQTANDKKRCAEYAAQHPAKAVKLSIPSTSRSHGGHTRSIKKQVEAGSRMPSSEYLGIPQDTSEYQEEKVAEVEVKPDINFDFLGSLSWS